MYFGFLRIQIKIDYSGTTPDRQLRRTVIFIKISIKQIWATKINQYFAKTYFRILQPISNKNCLFKITFVQSIAPISMSFHPIQLVFLHCFFTVFNIVTIFFGNFIFPNNLYTPPSSKVTSNIFPPK